jgi:hypothetical protein
MRLLDLTLRESSDRKLIGRVASAAHIVQHAGGQVGFFHYFFGFVR